MLNEIGQTEKLYHLYVDSKKYNTLVNVKKKKLTHRYRELVVNSGERRETGEGHDRSRGLRDINYSV